MRNKQVYPFGSADDSSSKKLKPKKKNASRDHYFLPKEQATPDGLLISRLLARVDRLIDCFDRIADTMAKQIELDSQRLEMQIRDSMIRSIQRTEQQDLYKRVLADPHVKKVVVGKNKKG